jgi:tripartite-type tricarboxylate transporter receptor subunit TctC
MLRLAAGALLLEKMPKVAHAQSWPARPLKIIVGTAAGGSPDIIARILGEKFADRLGQSVVIENNTQGAGVVAEQVVNKSPPDGYTLMMLTGGYPARAALRKPAFDPLDGFAFVSGVCGYPMVYAVAPNSPIKSFKDMLERAKAAPGKLTYTINAHGSIHHVLTKWIEMEAGAPMTPVPYRGAGPALTDVLGGRVDVMVEAATSAFPRLQAGQMRVLALSSPERYPLMPDAPIVAEFVPGIEFMSWLGLAMAPGTPAPIVERVNQEVRHALTLPDVQARLVEGGNIATPSSPAEFRARVEREIARWRHVVTAAGIKEND